MRSEEEQNKALVDAQFQGWLMGYRDGKHDALLKLKLEGNEKPNNIQGEK